MPKPKRPTPALINSYLRKWETLENYIMQERSLSLLFNKFCPGNTRLENVLLKVTALNAFYSTNIFATFQVAKHILRLKIDDRLKKGDQLLVNDLARVKISGTRKNFYSFASKYCNHHVPDQYPIFDYYVEKMLWHYSKTDGFAQFTKKNLKNYSQFVRVITAFRKFYKLGNFSLRQIDIYLWLAGKKCFPRNYGKRKR